MGDISRYKGGACKKMKSGGAVKAPRKRAKKMAVGGAVAMPSPPDIYPGKPGVPFETPRPPVVVKPPVPPEVPRPIAGSSPMPLRAFSRASGQAMKRGGKVKGGC